MYFKLRKKSVDINSTLWQSNDGKSYVKILYNNSGVIDKLNELGNEIIINTDSLLHRKSILSIHCMVTFINSIIVVVYLNDNVISRGRLFNQTSIFTNSFHECYLGNNLSQGSIESFNGRFYDFMLLYGIEETDAYYLHQYYKYIHNI